MKLITALVAFSAAAFASASSGNYTYLETSQSLLPPDLWYLEAPACAGTAQSPVALNKDTAGVCDKPPFIFSGGNCKVGNLVAEANPGNGADLAFAAGSCQPPSLQLGSTTYNFKALHVHSLAEHAIGPNAALPDAELHLVHFNAANPNDLLVIGVHLRAKSTSLLGSVLDLLAAITGLPLYSSSQCSSALAAIFGKISAATGGPAFSGSNNALLNLYDLVPRAAYFTYPGSLTTPPCSETVTWIVAQQLVRITPEQLQQYRDSVDRVPGSLASAEGFNNRPLQALNGRVVRTCQF